ncbi:helix-turn-helix domain-containing protein [Arthrobacter sp. ISL-30]|uniref:AlbA family DNA-binding domain-containing protein n=1 Tax=Arthrobacter sp. ISL-30 TaxID=2819109 RepID=UPI001BE64520|nr:ATP-binding protein [Arthrobacter sp. ISL-30]MBT2514519.1 ATP-binding protein [Arthrobacter sp. ISL-30]
MDVTTLTLDQVRILSSTAEDHFQDRKSARIAPAKLTKTMSAFANADGGELLVGIEDDGTWAGLAEIEGFNGHLQAMEPLFPYGSEFKYEFFQHPSEQTYVLVSCA